MLDLQIYIQLLPCHFVKALRVNLMIGLLLPWLIAVMALDVFLMNEHKVSVTILTVEQTDVVLEQVCKELNIPEDLMYCFSLFLIRRDEDGDITIVRKLQDFESPYISQKALSAMEESSDNTGFAGPLKIVLRKSSWDASLDDRLLVEQPTLNLLFIQTVVEMLLACAVIVADMARCSACRGARRRMRRATAPRSWRRW